MPLFTKPNLKTRIVSGLYKFPTPEPWTLKEFSERRNWILIERKTGGLGDILMTRMMIEDFKLLCPDIKVAFSCPQMFMSVLQDHPFIDVVYDMDKINPHTFPQAYDITTICGRTEQKMAPFSAPHRSDIWANSCGIELTRHNMHLSIKPEELAVAKSKVFKQRKGESFSVAVCPISAMKSKNLEENQFNPVIKEIRAMGGFVYGLNSRSIPVFDGPVESGDNYREFMAMVGAADYVITVDSAAFHIAGGLDIPQVGVFSWADGRVYGKYYSKWELVQRHRDNGNWNCGPCYTWGECPKCPHNQIRKPCITEISAEEIIEAFRRLVSKYPHA